MSIKNFAPHIVAIAIFLGLSMIYFSPQLEGKVDNSGDMTAARAIAQELLKYRDEMGRTPLWTNALFGGMPTYQLGAAQPNNLTQYLEKGSRFNIRHPIGMFFAGMLIFYIMLVLLGVNPWLSLIGAIAFGFTTNNYILYGAGHITKVRAIIHLGLVTAGILLAFRKKYLLGGLIFATGFALELYVNHIQMTYYFFLSLLIYGVIELVQHIQKNDMASFGKAFLYLTIGGLIAIGSSSSKLWTTYEYGKDTMRGQPILEVENNGQTTSSNTVGLEYEYATRWSNGGMDLIAGFIPGVVGGGSVTYWGPNEDGTAGPAYFGAIVCFLFIFGLIVVKGPVKWWLAGGVLLIALISMGKNFFLYHTFYDYLPLFNKFRAPNSALGVVAFLMPILGILALDDVIKGKVEKEKVIKAIYIAGGILAAFCLFFALMGGSFFDFSYVKDAAYEQNYNYNIKAIKDMRANMMSEDAWRSLGLIIAAGALLWLFTKEKINQVILLAGLGVLICGDLWFVNQDYLNENNFVKATEYKKKTAPSEVDKKILTDKDPYYRIFDISKGLGGAVNSADASYYHKNVGGYHPAKLQRYQDMLDRHILPEGQQLIGTLQGAKSLADVTAGLQNLHVLNMMNTKYIIANDQAPIPNSNALGNAWFVDAYEMAKTNNDEINQLRGVNPAQKAIIHEDFASYLSGMTLQKGGTIQLTSYHPEKLTYATNTPSEQLAIFSEVWYGPDKGWNAYIDDAPVEHIRANYILRGLKVPAGQHTVEFRFEPKSYFIGETISLICSLLIVLGLLGYIGYWYKNRPPVEVKEEKVVAAKKEIKATKSKRKKK